MKSANKFPPASTEEYKYKYRYKFPPAPTEVGKTRLDKADKRRRGSRIGDPPRMALLKSQKSKVRGNVNAFSLPGSICPV